MLGRRHHGADPVVHPGIRHPHEDGVRRLLSGSVRGDGRHPGAVGAPMRRRDARGAVIDAGEEEDRAHRGLVEQARPATQVQRVAGFLPAGLDEQVEVELLLQQVEALELETL